ncbi:BTAD domain-containing putative transcriptional regulator [Streptomyces sp. NPDC006923]|uniref:AfsR/SARP family transcriptional regulator n=1 Tax=Streptomyces sp. NPDC006923 TaxID=3155355 RepID=UPI0033F0A036
MVPETLTADAVRWTLLGPLEGFRDGTRLPLGPPRRRALLAALLVRAGSPISVAEIVDALWGQWPPDSAVNVVHRHIGELRRLLQPGLPRRATGRWILPSGGGYCLRVDADTLDLLKFRGLMEQARQAGEPTRALRRATQALDLWHGPVAQGIPDEVRRNPLFASLDREITAALCEAGAIALRAGAPHRVLPALQSAVAHRPLDEALRAQQLLVLAGAGHQAEACAEYEEIREKLLEELGIEPGPELRAAHRRIVGGLGFPPGAHAARDTHAEASGTAAGHLADQGDTPASFGRAAPKPAQLPLDPPSFVGRQAELDRVLALVGRRDDGPGKTLVISAIEGTAGIGKTTLAVHLAHLLSDRFPDGQLYIDLRGYDPTRPPLGPQEVLHYFLHAIGVAPQRIPGDIEGQSALYRSMLAGKRFLVVLDNAADARQVRPLLPGTPNCLVLVTSRNQLLGLVAQEGAYPLALDVLTPDDAQDFMVRRLGAGRVAAEPEAVLEIIALCAKLPLALAIVAARAAAHPGFSLASVAERLRQTDGTLDGFAGPDGAVDVRTVFSWSCTGLSPRAARLFRLLALRPGPDVTLAAAAALADLPVSDARVALGELTASRLVSEHLPGRYTYHDLLHAYASELSRIHETEAARRTATRRVLNHYVLHAKAAAALIDPESAFSQDPPPALFPAEAAAMNWLVAERHVLAAAVHRAAEAELPDHAWQLAHSLDRFQELRGDWHEWAAVQREALEAAGTSEDLNARAYSHRGLGRAYSLLRRYDQALCHLERALRLFTELESARGQAHTHRALSWVMTRKNKQVAALRHAEAALDLYRSVGHLGGQADSMNSISWFLTLSGQGECAVTRAHQALVLHRTLGDGLGEARVLDTLGFAHDHLGNHEMAIRYYQQAVALFEEHEDSYNRAGSHSRLGDSYERAGDDETARRHWEVALSILGELDPSWAAEISVKIPGPESRPTS